MRKLLHPLLAGILAVSVLVTGCTRPLTTKVEIFPTSAPEAASTTALLPTATAQPTATPSPTPPPAARVEIAEQEIFLGSYEQARKEFQAAQSSTSDTELQAVAAMGIGRTLYLQRNYSMAIKALEEMNAAYPDSSSLANAYFFLAKSYEGQKQYDKAADAYGKFLELRPDVIDAYVQRLRGNALMAAGSPAAAAEAYSASIQAPQEGTTVWTELELGKAYAASGDFSSAIQTYLSVYENTDNLYARAQANLLMGQAYLTMGMPEQANARFLDSVYNFPEAYDTYNGLIHLVNSGVQVNELSRGLVDYYAGQYGLAVEAFTRYIDATVDLDATAYHYRALSRLNMNEPGRALEDWDYVIENFRGDPLWATAWEEKAYTLWAYLDMFDEASQTLLAFVEEAPESGHSPELLFQAGRVLERDQQLIAAAETWERLINEYPSAEQSFRGLFLAGIAYYRAGEYDRALTVFQRYLVLANSIDEQSAAYLWIGKSQQALGEEAAARTAWQQGATLDPTGYYSERSNELLQNRQPFTVTRPVDLGYDLAAERGSAEAWMRSTFGIPPETDLSGLGELASDARIQRGAAFWELGLYEEARNEFESLRKAVATQAEPTFRLMNYLLELGVYRSAILASRQILDLSGMDDVGTLQAPAYFNHIRFGVFFKDAILQASQSEDLHPLLLLSIMRQESMFEGFAISIAGARGLMQIMPATGQEIASSMGWPDEYTAEDLYRPEVSILMGTRYLKRQLTYFGGNSYAMLAAYNGGPGNTIIWNELAGSDPDLLLEVIRVDETRLYITNIYEYFIIYRLLYERGL